MEETLKDYESVRRFSPSLLLHLSVSPRVQVLTDDAGRVGVV